MKPQTLKTFKRWYSIVVMAIIAALLIAAYMNYGKPACMLFVCFAVLSALMLVVTNSLIKQMLPKENKKEFRNHK